MMMIAPFKWSKSYLGRFLYGLQGHCFGGMDLSQIYQTPSQDSTSRVYEWENATEQKLKDLVLNQVESTYKDHLESSKS